MKTLFNEVLILGSGAALLYGLWEVYQPLPWIIGGGGMLIAGIFNKLHQSKEA